MNNSDHLHPMLTLNPTLNRRRWLQFAGSALAGAAGLGGLAAMAPAARAGTGYKALVCVFLYGGNDGMNMVVPSDLARHNQYAAVRGNLALPRASLVGLGGTDLGLHPSMAALQPVWAAGHLAPVLNLGPLVAPLTKAQYLAAPASALPDALFSHSDQQILWEAAGHDALARTGWGGRASTVVNTVNPVISVGGNGHFGLSDLSSPLVLPGPGSNFGLEGMGTWAPEAARRAAINALYTGPLPGTLLNAFAGSERNAMGVAERLNGLIGTMPDDASPALRNAFAPVTSPDGSLIGDFASQLFQVAKLIEGRGTVLGTQQIFFTQMGGFDTHSTQISTNSLNGDHARLMKTLADGMACFHNAMTAIDMADCVTLFTQSDFGRTFAPNSSTGTDHAWGNHQLVMGAAVQGNASYGSYPELVLGGPNDVGVSSWELQGRWIPTLSVDQYAATLLSWFGVSDAQLNTVLPNLANFGSARNIGFV